MSFLADNIRPIAKDMYGIDDAINIPLNLRFTMFKK